MSPRYVDIAKGHTMTLVRFVLGLVVLLSSLSAHAQGKEQRAKEMYEQGRVAFEKQQYETAYQRFHEAYVLSEKPALLYNVASALSGMNKPGAAADALRTYLRLMPNDPERKAIEARITRYQEAQRITDQVNGKAEPQPQVQPAPILVVTPAPEPRKKSRRGLVIGLSVAGAVVVVGLAVGLGVGLAPRPLEPLTQGGVGPITATP